MSIVLFKKVTVVGLIHEKEEVLQALQTLGCMHLIAINKASHSKLTTPSTTPLDNIKMSLRYLKNSPEQGLPRRFWKEAKPKEIVEKILANQRAFRECIDHKDFLKKRINCLYEWGNFILPKEDELANLKLWFYKIPLKKLTSLPKEVPMQELYRTNNFIYLVLCSHSEPELGNLSSFRVHLGSVSLHQLQLELEELESLIEDLIHERRSLTRYHYLLAQKIAHFTDRTELKKAKEKLLEKNEFFLIQGWIPQTKIPKLEALNPRFQLGIVIEAPLSEELPPTLLESSPWLKGGHELVQFYQTPGYHALDPSFMVFFSFSLFFSMILADAGYGLIIALGTLLSFKRLGKHPQLAWLRPLLVSLSLFSIIYGVLLGSYWGVAPKPGSFLASFYLINIHDFKSMMALVLIIGCIHIAVGCALRAWFATTLNEKLKAIGFILLITSAVFYAVGKMQQSQFLSQFTLGLFIFSIFLILSFAADNPIKGMKSILKRILHGFAALAELPSLFGDILSYLRLFALGLAGASLAITFNAMAHHLAQTSMVLAFLVLFLGQGLNFFLCLMSAVIHGLRLNYIEFFKWSIKEDGYSYNPFKKQEITHE